MNCTTNLDIASTILVEKSRTIFPMPNRIEKQCLALAEWVHHRMETMGIAKAADLARLSQVSPQSISRILKPKPLPDTGKYALPRRELMRSLARPLGVTENEALEAAGYLSNPSDGEDVLMIFILERGSTTPITITDPEVLAAAKKAYEASQQGRAEDVKTKPLDS